MTSSLPDNGRSVTPRAVVGAGDEFPPERRVQQIVETLELDIVLGRLHPCQRLVEHALAERFGTNRATVRAALTELERRALIVRRRNLGATVIDLSPEEVEQLYAAREIVETAAAALITYPVEQAVLDRLKKLQEDHSAAVAAGDLRKVFQTNIRFHAEINAICGNPHLIEMVELLAARSFAVRSYAHLDPAMLEEAARTHWAMIDALENADRDRLVALRRAHLQPSKGAYIEAYRWRFGMAADRQKTG